MYSLNVSRGSWGNLFHGLLQLFRVCSLACDCIVHFQSPAQYLPITLSDSDAPASLPYKDLYDYFGSTHNIQNKSPYPKSLIISTKSLLPCKVTYSLVSEIRVWASWVGGIILICTNNKQHLLTAHQNHLEALEISDKPCAFQNQQHQNIWQ